MSVEYLDVVSTEDIVLEKRSRSEVHELGLWHRGAHVFLFTSDGKMLIQQRSADRKLAPLKWDCAVSEHVQAGESYFQAAMRGLKEEMGVEGIKIEPMVKFRMNYGYNDNEISVLYKGIVEPAKVKFDPGEIESIQYLSMDEIENLLINEPEALCGWFVEMLNWNAGRKSALELMTL